MSEREMHLKELGFKQLDFVSCMDDFRFCIVKSIMVGSSYHWHGFIEILFCLDGEVEMTVDNSNYLLHPGDMVLIGSNVIHKTGTPGEKGSIYNILFDPAIIQNVNYCSMENRCINAFLSYLSSYSHHFIGQKELPEEFLQILTKMDECYHSYREYNSVYVHAYLLQMIGKLCEYGFFSAEAENSSRQVTDAVRSTVDYINSHYMEKLTLSQMAEMANLSYYYYSRLFKMITGKSFSSFLASVRVFMAEKLMISGEYSLTEVADKVGLYPQSYFNHTYKRLRGFSPHEFMKRVQK